MEETRLQGEDGMRAEGAIKAGTLVARVEGFWRAAAYPLTPAENVKNNRHLFAAKPPPQYSLQMDLAEASGLTYYINQTCIANAFNDFRSLSGTHNCDLVTTWCAGEAGSPPYSGGPTFNAIIESTVDIADGAMCYVDYGKQRLLDMMLFTGADHVDDVSDGDNDDPDGLFAEDNAEREEREEKEREV